MQFAMGFCGRVCVYSLGLVVSLMRCVKLCRCRSTATSVVLERAELSVHSFGLRVIPPVPLDRHFSGARACGALTRLTCPPFAFSLA